MLFFWFFSEEADLLARALGCRLLRTSVKEDINVNAVFRQLAARCLAELREPRFDDFCPPPPPHATGLPPLAAFSPQRHQNGHTIVLKPVSAKQHKKKKSKVLKNACRIL